MKDEYRRLLHQCRSEITAVPGTDTVREMLLERYCFTYAALRTMEKDWEHVDTQRYNQLLEIWRKMGKDLLESYRTLYEKGALQDVFVAKIMSIVGEEVADSETLRRIRERLRTAQKEDAAQTAR